MAVSLLFVLGLGFSACDYQGTRPDPNGEYGCAGFLMCANGHEFSMPCQPNEYFDPESQFCSKTTSPTACQQHAAGGSAGSASAPSPVNGGQAYVQDTRCPDGKMFYDFDGGFCDDPCWTDETVAEMCTAISDECGTVDCDSMGCASEWWEAESSMVEYNYCKLNEHFNPWHVCKGHCRDGTVFQNGRCVPRDARAVRERPSSMMEPRFWPQEGRRRMSCPDCLGDMCDAPSVSGRSVQSERVDRLDRITELLGKLIVDLEKPARTVGDYCTGPQDCPAPNEICVDSKKGNYEVNSCIPNYCTCAPRS